MSRGLNKTLFRIHGWIGLTLGLLLFIVCFSGTIATVSSEIDWLLNPAIRAEPVGSGAARSWERWYQAVSAAHPEAHVLFLSAPPADGWAVAATVAYGRLDFRHVYVHPDTGEAQGTFSQFNVKRFFRSFHKQFYIYPGSLPNGIWIVGPLALVLLFSVGTGISFYKIRWSDLLMQRRSRGARTWLSTFHRAGGVWMLAFSLVFALTGLWYFVERVAQDTGLPLTGVEALTTGEAVTRPTDAERMNLDAAVAVARETFPELQVQAIYFPVREGSAITLYGEAEAWLVRPTANYVLLDPYTGDVLGRQDARDLSPPSRLIQSVDPLHFGSFGGLPTKLLWLTAGLVISASILSGPFLWFLRLQQGGPSQETLHPIAARGALAVTLAVLALATYGSIVNIGDSIPHASRDLVPAYVWVVVGGFVATTALVSVCWLSVLANPRTGRRGVPFASMESHAGSPGQRRFNQRAS